VASNESRFLTSHSGTRTSLQEAVDSTDSEGVLQLKVEAETVEETVVVSVMVSVCPWVVMTSV